MKKTQILMLMFALLKQIDPQEHTRPSSKLAMQMKKYLRNMWLRDYKYHDKQARAAETVWEKAKTKINSEVGADDFTVSIRATLQALYGLLEIAGGANTCFTEKTFVKALNSIEANGFTNLEVDDALVEKWSNMLIDIFAAELEIPRDSKLKILKAKVAGNLLLQGKLKKEFQ